MKTIRPPQNFGDLIDAVNTRDREFFAAHPDAESYRRVYVPGEFYPILEEFHYVEVWRIADGVRVRLPIVKESRE